MTRSLAISKRQAQTLLRAAEKEKAIVEVTVGKLIFRLIPKCLVDAPLVDGTSTLQNFGSLDEYRKWREMTGAGRD